MISEPCVNFVSPLATGDGDVMMRYCPSYRVVHLMGEGLTVQDACDQVILEMKQRHGKPFEVAIIALNMKVRKLRIKQLINFSCRVNLVLLV